MVLKVQVKALADRASSAPFLPGSGQKYAQTLRTILKGIGEEAGRRELPSGLDAGQLQKQIGVLGMTQRDGADLCLTRLGRDWLVDSSSTDLFQVLHANVAFIGEALARIIQEPASVEDLREYANSHYLMAWRSQDQIRRRMAWFESMGLVELWPDHQYHLTEGGLQAIGTVDFVSPHAAREYLASLQQEEVISPPPLLHEVVENASAASRLSSWPYLTGSPVETLSLVAKAALNGTTKPELCSLVSEKCGIKPSSARSAVDAIGAMGLYEFAGSAEVRTTRLGVEWLGNDSPLNLVRLLHSRYLAVGEVLLQFDDSPRNAGEVHLELFGNADNAPRQDRTAGVLRRMVEAGAVAMVGTRYALTGIGRALRQELPMFVRPAGEQLTDSGLSDSDPHTSGCKSIIRELEESSRDSSHPDRFEKACAAAFIALGVDARHYGGAGKTDVAVTVKSGLDVLARAIVDAKSASGQLNENSISFEALDEHALKHGATLKVVVAPDFGGSGRLASWATPHGVVLLSVSELAQLLRDHEVYPFSAEEVAGLLKIGGREEAVAGRQEQLRYLALVSAVLGELSAEAKQEHPEPISARDIGRAMRRAGQSASDEDVADSLAFLALPQVAAVRETAGRKYVLPSSRSVSAGRLRAIARVIGGEHRQ